MDRVPVLQLTGMLSVASDVGQAWLVVYKVESLELLTTGEESVWTVPSVAEGCDLEAVMDTGSGAVLVGLSLINS